MDKGLQEGFIFTEVILFIHFRHFLCDGPHDFLLPDIVSKYLHPHVPALFFVDACHSGTILDLQNAMLCITVATAAFWAYFLGNLWKRISCRVQKENCILGMTGNFSTLVGRNFNLRIYLLNLLTKGPNL